MFINLLKKKQNSHIRLVLCKGRISWCGQSVQDISLGVSVCSRNFIHLLFCLYIREKNMKTGECCLGKWLTLMGDHNPRFIISLIIIKYILVY